MIRQRYRRLVSRVHSVPREREKGENALVVVAETGVSWCGCGTSLQNGSANWTMCSYNAIIRVERRSSV